MRLISRPLPGMLVLQAEPRIDQRGYFARCFCRTELAQWGVTAPVEQANLSSSERALTLRGLHYQVGPSAETKVVTCLQGSLHDVVLDLRADSPTFGEHAVVELSGSGKRLLVIPPGCAHGFMTRENATLLLYMVSSAYDPTRERAVRWDDPGFAIEWPDQPRAISPRDAAIPDFDPGHHLAA
jgi:dTDP-4-dehydrorhamnose 3,5-epimerase